MTMMKQEYIASFDIVYDYCLLIQIKWREMIDSNALISYNCIPQLIQGSIEGQFKLQIRQAMPTANAFMILLSDSCSWVKVEVVGQALCQVNLYKIEDLISAVIIIRGEDITFLPKGEFRLKKIQRFNTSIKQPIGFPLPYTKSESREMQVDSKSLDIEIPRFQSIEHMENTFDKLHFSGEDKVPSQFLLISTVKLMSTGLVEGRIRARVLKKPASVKSFMMITIEDEAGDRIQCCCFGDLAYKYKDFLLEKNWYCFQNVTLQTNNQNGSIELKLTPMSKITDEKGQGLVSIEKKELQRPLSLPNSNPRAWSNNKRQIKEFDIGRASKQEINISQDYFIIAHVIRKNSMKPERGRSFECIDAKGYKFEIMLWKECEADVLIGETYKFEDLKVKVYNGNISLQSQGRFTKVTVHSSKIDPKTINIPGRGHTFSSKVYKNSDVVLVREMQERIHSDFNKQQSQRQVYFTTSGILTVHVGEKERYMHQMKEKLFFALCEHCKRSGKSRLSVEMIDNKVVCEGCKKADYLSIMWKINVVLMDRTAMVSCALNSEVTIKLIGKTPLEGLVIFFDSPQKLKRLIQKKINYFRGVFKFSIKANKSKPDKPFYNIVESYDNDSSLNLQRAKKEMMKSLEAYQKAKAQKQARILKAQMLKVQKDNICEQNLQQVKSGENSK